MIGTVWRVGWLNLLRDRPALALTFVMPLLFFSIFAAVFGAMDREGMSRIDVALVYQGGESTQVENDLERLLRADGRVTVVGSLLRAEALGRLRSGELAAAIVVPATVPRVLGGASRTGETASIEILVDERANPIAAGALEGAVRAAVFRLWLESSFPGGGGDVELPVEIAVSDVVESTAGERPAIAFFAAGIGVMFLLFAVSGRGSLLLEERESGVLTRMLTTGVGLSPLLAGRWLYLASLGFVQVTAMFVWGAMVFGLDLWDGRRLVGFALMTFVTAGAAAALGLLLSVVCRTRAQLNGVAVVLVLAMSALGGSLFPRFLMPESLQRLGLATFNAWALDGYQKVFWYGSPLVELWPQLAFLGGLAMILLALSRAFAQRWVTGIGS